jgi:hypothetical protein
MIGFLELDFLLFLDVFGNHFFLDKKRVIGLKWRISLKQELFERNDAAEFL